MHTLILDESIFQKANQDSVRYISALTTSRNVDRDHIN